MGKKGLDTIVIIPDNIKKFSPLIILIILCSLLYFNSLSNGFTYDDYPMMIDNSNLKVFNNNLSSFFNLEYFKLSREQTYRPMDTIQYLISFNFFKTNPFGYHFISIILHIINVLLIFSLANILFKNKVTAFIISLLFLSHPILTEAIDSISFNDDLLVTLFYLLSFKFYLKFKENDKKKLFFYLLSLLFLLISLLSKEMGITLIALIILYDLFIGQEKTKKKELTTNNFFKNALIKIKKNKYYYLGYLAVSVLYLLLLFFILKNPQKFDIDSHASFLKRIIFIPYNIFLFIKLTLFPVNLSADYFFSYRDNFFSLINIISYILVFGIMLLSFFIYKYSKKIFFGIWWFFITLIPVLNIIEIYNPFAERYLYLPTVGFSIILGVLLTEGVDKIKLNNSLKQGIKIFLVIIIFSFYSYQTFKRNPVWKDEITLWTNTINHSPNSLRGNYNLGNEYLKINSFDEAEIYYKRTIELMPNHISAHVNLGIVYLKKGLFQEAILEFKKILKINPDDILSHINLGIAYAKIGLFEEAISEFKIANKINPSYVDAYLLLGNAYMGKNLINEAVAQFKNALEYSPDSIEASFKLSFIYINLKMFQEAFLVCKNAIKLNPQDVGLHLNLASVYYLQNNLMDALDEYEEVVRIKPDYAEAYLKIGEIYTNFNILDKAEENLLKYTKFNFNNAEAYYYLGNVFATQNKLAEAITEWEKSLKINPAYTPAKENIIKAKSLLLK